jgi:hypothetical protein
VEVRGIKDEGTERERESGAVHTASTIMLVTINTFAQL